MERKKDDVETNNVGVDSMVEDVIKKLCKEIVTTADCGLVYDLEGITNALANLVKAYKSTL